ncbi:MAG: site-specific integrase, partial [Ruminiclostridium sp.]|nr:site-specific integrase [Ruminiclostridium sp.]
MAVKNTLAASVQCKKGRLYAVIQIKENGKSKSVWRTLNLPEGSNKTKIQKAYREVVSNFEEEYAAMLARKDRSDADISIFEYVCA